jgi:hypothetical protein
MARIVGLLVVHDGADLRWRVECRGDEVGEHGGGVGLHPGITCWYTEIVNAGLAWPSRSLTTFTGTPAFNRIVACVCLRSCRRMWDRSERVTSRSNDWENTSGLMGVPSGRANSRSLSW